MPEINLEDPTAQKMFDAFKKLTMHQFWKKVKGAVKEQGDPEEKAAFKALYKSFDMNLGKILDKFDKGFPDLSEMKKHTSQLDAIFKSYEKKIDEAEVDQKSAMLLAGTIDKLDAEVKRRMAWVKKFVK